MCVLTLKQTRSFLIQIIFASYYVLGSSFLDEGEDSEMTVEITNGMIKG